MASTTQHPTKSVAAAIKRLLRIDDKTANALMPNGENDRDNYVGGYDMSGGKSEAQELYDRDTDGWIVLD